MDKFERAGFRPRWAYAVTRSCENKAVVVAADEREAGERALLNLGHTFGHAIEAGLGFGTWLHGEAVAAGTMLAARLSERMGLLNAREVERVASPCLCGAGLPVEAPSLGEERYLELMGHDKKVEDGKLRLILLRSLGRAFVTSDFALRDLREVLAGTTAACMSWRLMPPIPQNPAAGRSPETTPAGRTEFQRDQRPHHPFHGVSRRLEYKTQFS